MFKNATVIGFNRKALSSSLIAREHHFAPLGDLERERSGWSPVRGDEIVYHNNGHYLLHFTSERKILPAGAIKLVAAEKAAALEEQQGFPPGKKAMKELKERVVDELLPRALKTRTTTKVWIDRAAGRIVIDSCSNGTIHAIQKLLIKTFGDISMQDVRWPRAKVMTAWLDDAPACFTLDDAVTLQYPGERGKVVKYTRANLGYADVLGHVRSGASVQTLAMTFDDRISFVMTDAAQIRRVKALDILKEDAAAVKDVDRFDNDFVLMTGELSRLFNALAEEA